MTITTHRNYIFLKPITEDSKLVLPPIFLKSLQTAQRGVVKYCGPSSFVNEGETVVFDKYTDEKVQINGEELVVAQPHQIIAVE